MFIKTIVALLSSTACTHAVRKDYEMWCVGNCNGDVPNDKQTTTKPGVVLMGGGVCLFIYLLFNKLMGYYNHVILCFYE